MIIGLLILAALAGFGLLLRREYKQDEARRIADENALVDAKDLRKDPKVELTKHRIALKRKPKKKQISKEQAEKILKKAKQLAKTHTTKELFEQLGKASLRAGKKKSKR